MAKAKADQKRAAIDRAPQSLGPATAIPNSDVASRAYELYDARAREHGHDVEDWLQAERELQARLVARLDQLADDGDLNVP